MPCPEEDFRSLGLQGALSPRSKNQLSVKENPVGNKGVLDGKVAIVTGARGGIGAAEAKSLASAGAKVVGCDLSHCDLLPVRDEIAAEGGDFVALQCDVREKKQIEDVVDRTVEKVRESRHPYQQCAGWLRAGRLGRAQ